MAIDRLEIRLGYERFGFRPHPRLSVITDYWRHGIDLVADQLLEALTATLGGSLREAESKVAPLLVFDDQHLLEHATRVKDHPEHETFPAPDGALTERARQLIVPFPRGATLILRDPFAGLGSFDLLAALATVADVSRRHQLLLLTDDPRQVGWAGILADGADASVVPIDGLLDPRTVTIGTPPTLQAAA